MGTIQPTYVENITILALKTDLGGTENVEADWDVMTDGPYDAISAHIGYAPGATPADGLTIKVYGSYNSGAAIRDLALLTSIAPFAIQNSTTVDGTSAAAQAVLQVAATTAFAVGDLIIIDQTNGNSEREWGRIASIDAGVSVTLEDNLVGEKTSGNASTVQVWDSFAYTLDLGGISFLRFRLENEDSDSGDDCAVEIMATARKGYTSA